MHYYSDLIRMVFLSICVVFTRQTTTNFIINFEGLTVLTSKPAIIHIIKSHSLKILLQKHFTSECE